MTDEKPQAPIERTDFENITLGMRFVCITGSGNITIGQCGGDSMIIRRADGVNTFWCRRVGADGKAKYGTIRAIKWRPLLAGESVEALPPAKRQRFRTGVKGLRCSKPGWDFAARLVKKYNVASGTFDRWRKDKTTVPFEMDQGFLICPETKFAEMASVLRRRGKYKTKPKTRPVGRPRVPLTVATPEATPTHLDGKQLEAAYVRLEANFIDATNKRLNQLTEIVSGLAKDSPEGTTLKDSLREMIGVAVNRANQQDKLYAGHEKQLSALALALGNLEERIAGQNQIIDRAMAKVDRLIGKNVDKSVSLEAMETSLNILRRKIEALESRASQKKGWFS